VVEIIDIIPNGQNISLGRSHPFMLPIDGNSAGADRAFRGIVPVPHDELPHPEETTRRCLCLDDALSMEMLDSRDVRSALVTIGAPIKPSNSEHAPLTRLPGPAAICRKDGCWTHRLMMATTCRLMMGRKGTFTL
jgi:hypothetical protein